MDLFRSNRPRLIKNPLEDRTPTELDEDVSQFLTRHKLENVLSLDVLKRGARVAKNPANYTAPNVPGITPAEQDALKRERDSGFWDQTKDLKVTILTTACAAVVQGWQQSSINAAAAGWSKAWCIDDYSWKFSGLNAAAPLFGSLVTWLSDPLQEKVFGRRPALFTAGVFSLCSVIGSGCAQNWWELLICRLLLGIGIGTKASIAPVLAAEVSVDHLRGSFIMTWQLFDAFGIFLGFAFGLIFFNNWRLILAAPFIPAVSFLLLVYICPESPRYLIRVGHYDKAYKSLCYLRETELQAARDLYTIHSQLQIETELFLHGSAEQWYCQDLYQKQVRSNTYWQRVKSLITIPRNRRALLPSTIVMLTQMLCGINVLTFYSSRLFFDTSSDLRSAAWFSCGFGLANFLFTIPAYKRIDSHGRRYLLLNSLFGMIWSLLAVALCFRITDHGTRVGTVAAFIFVFTFFYSIGAGPVPFTFSAEVFPLAFREVGMSFGVMVNLLGLGLLVLFVPRLTSALGHSNAPADQEKSHCGNPVFYAVNTKGESKLVGIFAGFNTLAFILVFLLVPSTAKPNLEEMNYIFGVEIIEHVKFQLFENIPWLFRRYLSFDHSSEGSELPFMNPERRNQIVRDEESQDSSVGEMEEVKTSEQQSKIVKEDSSQVMPSEIENVNRPGQTHEGVRNGPLG